MVDGARRKEILMTTPNLEALRSDLERANVPYKDHAALVSDAIDETAAITAARELLDADPREWCLLVLAGPPGVGKTTAGGFAIAEWLRRSRTGAELDERGHGPRFVGVHRLGRLSRYAVAAWEAIERCPLLVLDDLGMEYLDRGGYSVSVVDCVFSARYAAELPLIVTTNLDLFDFTARYGERVADRLRESGRYVGCTGPSLRGRG
jgi:hypothetical protein